MGAREDIIAQLAGTAPPPAMGSLMSQEDAAAMQPETFANPAVKHALGSLANMVTTPGRVMAPNPYPAGSEEASWYDDQRGRAVQQWAPETAMTVMGGAGVVPAEANALRMGFKAYHGSPHDFDAFSMDKIGTGEGAQAYGHGLYFAENEGVAKAYRDALSGKADNSKVLSIDGQKIDTPTPAMNFLNKHRWDADSAVSAMQPRLNAATNKLKMASKEETLPGLSDYDLAMVDHKYMNDFVNELQSYRGKNAQWVDPGHMYEVNINADPEQFLDWDAPLPRDHPVRQKITESAQTALDRATTGANRNIAKDALLAAANENLTGQGAYQQLARTNTRPGLFPEINISQPAKASEILRDVGVPGIKYLDQGSRAAGDGSRNYVLFDDKLVNVARKYGMGSMAALPPAALGAASLGQGDNFQ